MEANNLTALSPLDGRYYNKTESLKPLFSEYGLIKTRLEVEIKWLIFLAKQPSITELDNLNNNQINYLNNIYQNFSIDQSYQIKEIEKTTNHDVKAVEYFLKNILSSPANNNQYNKYLSFLHFACTSEDINNLSYSLLLKQAKDNILTPSIKNINNVLTNMAKKYKTNVMLARTHGQSASPTTMGKELINFVARLDNNIKKFNNTKIYGKFNGAVGNYNAHKIAYPNINWPKLNQLFVESLGINFTKYSTQINQYDYIADYCQNLIKINNILLDLVKDIWGYISLGYFSQKLNHNEVGSSTMPHKVNPIDFENAEGNLGLANSLLEFFSNKLPISRYQRDLTDSTVLRNIGSSFGYCLIAYQSIEKGLNKLNLNKNLLLKEVNQHWEILGEAVQTVMRKYNIDDAYEQLKILTRGMPLNQTLLHEFINNQALPQNIKDELKQLTPEKYIGFACELIDDF